MSAQKYGSDEWKNTVEKQIFGIKFSKQVFLKASGIGDWIAEYLAEQIMKVTDSLFMFTTLLL